MHVSLAHCLSGTNISKSLSKVCKHPLWTPSFLELFNALVVIDSFSIRTCLVKIMRFKLYASSLFRSTYWITYISHLLMPFIHEQREQKGNCREGFPNTFRITEQLYNNLMFRTLMLFKIYQPVSTEVMYKILILLKGNTFTKEHTGVLILMLVKTWCFQNAYLIECCHCCKVTWNLHECYALICETLHHLLDLRPAIFHSLWKRMG